MKFEPREKHPFWKGCNITVRSGRSRAQRMYPSIGPCAVCGNPKSERHHKDGDTINNAPDNIEILCRKCHMQGDGRLDKLKSTALANLAAAIRAASVYRKSKSHCPKGHPYHGDNLYINPKGARCCRKCLNDYKKSQRLARRMAQEVFAL